ncbi:MAG TPA: septum formation initiator family protein [Acidobacteriota bacterium]|nr:septum formation initiator family protein [Acidobacteriota bacterium]
MAHKKSHLSHAKEIYYIVCIVLLVVMTMFSVWGPGGYMEMKRVRAELEWHRLRVEALRRNNNAKLQSIQALRSDKQTLENMARQNGFGRDGEIVQQLPEETKPNVK